MGAVSSLLCAFTFCIERVITWSCCAFLLVLLLFTLIILMIYGISVGYHYAQTELASFAMASRVETPKGRRADGGGGGGPEDQPVVRVVAVSRSEDKGPQQRPPETMTSEDPQFNVEPTTGTALVILETERAPEQLELSRNERDFAKRLIGRFRRSRKALTKVEPFLRPLRITNTTKLLLSF